MKIVFTAQGNEWSSPMDARFGRSEMFVSFDENTNELKIITNNETQEMEHGAGLQTSKKILDLNPNIIITGNGAGEKALKVLKTSGVKMYIGAGDMTLKEAYEAFKNNKLQLQY